MLRPLRSSRYGFALVLSLALTGLVFTVVLGFASWMHFATRAVAVRKENARAHDLAYMALKEAIFELEYQWGEDACVIIDCGNGRLDACSSQGSLVERIGRGNHSWETESCAYIIGPYREDAAVDLLAGSLLTNGVSGGLKRNIATELGSLGCSSSSLSFGDGTGVYGPLWQVLGSYVALCDRIRDGASIPPQAHGPLGRSRGYIPSEVSSETFLKTKPQWIEQIEATERGDPVRFALYPWLFSVDVTYVLDVERGELYYIPRIQESVRVCLYNPYDVSLTRSDYEVMISGGMPEVVARVGEGSTVRAALKDCWRFSVGLEAGEVKELHLPPRFVFEFPPVLESPGPLYIGLGGELPEKRTQPSPAQGSGRSLREALFNKRKERNSVQDSKPAVVKQVQFYLNIDGQGRVLLQRVNEASTVLFDASNPGVAIEKRVWELPRLAELVRVGKQPLFIWSYAANCSLANPGAALIHAKGVRAEASLPRVSLPRGVSSRIDLEAGLRGFYGTDPLVLGQGPADAPWERALSQVLWDDYFYPLPLEHYVGYPRGTPLQTPIEPEHVLLKGAFPINTLDADQWENFLISKTAELTQADRKRLAQALAEVVQERVPLHSMALFWGNQGVFQEAFKRAELSDALDSRRVMRDICEFLVVRPDTFLVSASGSVRSEGGVIATAQCEGVVQRVPEMGSAQGRRSHRIVAFRWLQKSPSLFEKGSE